MTQYFRLNDVIERDHDQATATQTELQATIDHRERSITELKDMVTKANQKIYELEEDIRKNTKEHKEYRIEVDKEMKRRQREEDVRAEKDLALKNTMSDRITFLSTMTSSYVQGLYEQCLAQEELILLEDSSSSLPNPKTSKMSSHKNFSKGETKETKLEIIMERLEKKVDSIHIDWEGMLEHDDDRRKIFGNLNNRSQINLSHIDDLIKKIRVKNQSDIERLEVGFKKKMEDNISKHQDDVFRLQKEINLKESSFRKVNATLKETKDHLSKALAAIDELNIVQERKNTEIDDLNNEIKAANKRQDNLQCELLLVRHLVIFE